MSKNKPGFSLRKESAELLGLTPGDWRTWIDVFAPHLPNTGDVVSLNDDYFLSMGAHATHQHMLMDRSAKEPLTVEKSFTACALVAFAIDSPVVPQHTEDQITHMAPNFSVLYSNFKDAGLRSPKS